MKEQKNKRIPISIIISIVMVIILTLGYQSIQIIQVSRNLDQQIKESKKEIVIEQEKLDSLQKQREQIDSLENVEKVAREKLGLVKKDEIVFKAKP